MSSQKVKIVNQARKVLATAEVAEEEGYFVGLIDLRSMPATLRKHFEQYEEVVNNQLFSHLDDIEEKIGTLNLRVVFEDGREAEPADVQIYPSTKRVSFKVNKKAVRRRIGKAS